MSTSRSEPAVNKSSNFKVADYLLDWDGRTRRRRALGRVDSV